MLRKITNFLRRKTPEEKRQKILRKLPINSFAKKLYSHKNLDKEIILLKIGKRVFNVTGFGSEDGAIRHEVLMKKLGKLYDFSKATLIHQHIYRDLPKNGPIPAHISEYVDFPNAIDNFKKLGIYQFEVSHFNKNLVEVGRTQYRFTTEFIKKINTFVNDDELIRFVQGEVNKVNPPGLKTPTTERYPNIMNTVFKNNNIIVNIKPLNKYKIKMINGQYYFVKKPLSF